MKRGMVTQEHDELSTVDDGMAQRPNSDPIAMERTRARVELAMFGVMKPPRLSRYEILDPVAGGGMGLVYAAFDPELERKVALKVVYPEAGGDPRSRDRLMREARALARLDHPHVVKVHDVISHDGQIVVVMALLEGETLSAWEQRERRDWRSTVSAYLQAGEGLAAAHSVDVVHRDFKPGNAIIGSDGHVRVLDFGLARLVSEPTGDDRATAGMAPSMPSTHTTTGAFVGTLAYASPEQLAGTAVTAASDQFSFCVAMHRAVEGVAPFDGATIAERALSIARGEPRVASDGRRVPAWLRAALRRGMSADPAQRHASMRALLDELGRARGLRRWRWPLAMTAVMLAAVGIGLAGSQRAPVCDDADAVVARVWGAPERVAVTSAFAALPLAIAGDLERRVLGGLDDHATSWIATRHGACLAHLHAEQSDALFDRKMLCLDRQLGDLTAAVAVLERTDVERATDATQVVAGIPRADRCDDAATLMDAPEPPRTPMAQVEVERIRAELSRAAALDHGGQSEDALALAKRATKAAEATGYSPIVAEAALELGRVLIGRQDPEHAVPSLSEAREAALASGRQARVAVEAGARLIYAEGALKPDLDRLARDLDYLDPMSAALPGDHFVRALLFNNAAEVYIMAKHPDDARGALEQARRAAGDSPDVELAAIDRNLAMLTRDPVERERLARAAWQRVRGVLGDHHPRTLFAQGVAGLFETDLTRADELIAPVCDDYRRFHPKLMALLIDCEAVHAFLAAEVGHPDEAMQAYEAVIATPPSPDSEVDRALATGELAALRGDTGHAASAFRDVIAKCGASEYWWERQKADQAELGLARIALLEHRPGEAAGELEIAAAGYTDVASTNPAIMYERRAEIAKRLLATLRESPEREKTTIH